MSSESRMSLVKARRSMEPVKQKEWVGGGLNKGLDFEVGQDEVVIH